MTRGPYWSARDEMRIKEWQLLLLRFAITRDPIDQAVAETAARPLDDPALPQAPTFTYFVRTTRDVCKDVSESRNEQAPSSLLKRFIIQIDDEHLRAAFSAALKPPCFPARRPRHRAAWRDRQDLWRGLLKR
jgi:hypothetical protein